MNTLFKPTIGDTVKQLFKFGGSFRKEAIVVAVTPAIIGIYSAMSEACAESCTATEALFAPSGLEWSALITGVVALAVHLHQKSKEAKFE